MSQESNSLHSFAQQFETLCAQLRNSSNEEEVRLAWVRALENCLGVTFSAERDWRDLSYNNIVIEFKGPGKFRGGIASPAFQEALQDRLLPYIVRVAEQEHLDESDYIGIAIDDGYIAFAQVIAGQVTHQNLLPLTIGTFGMVVEACRACHRRAITAGNLIEDFGHKSVRGIAFMRAIAGALADTGNLSNGTKIRMMFEEWRTLYGQVADLSKEQLSELGEMLRFAQGFDNLDVSARLFVVHTFNSLLAKLLAAEIVAAHGLASGRAFASDFVAMDDDSTLLARLRSDIEEGGFFEAVGIRGFVEEAIFSWYLDAATDPRHRSAIGEAIRNILTGMALYRTDKLEHARDVLRDFYQDLVPGLLRKSLGEFYTPDWLVEFTIDRAGVTNWVETRAVDPTCGSGSFLLEMIRRKREAASQSAKSRQATLDLILETVWGFDLNPLAVQTARTNFLMAIADLLKDAPGQEIEIPVLLADAVYSPAHMPGVDESLVEYQIGSQFANLRVLLPADLAFDRLALDRVLAVMGEFVEQDADYERCEAAFARRNVLTSRQLVDWAEHLKDTYEQVLELHRRSWNGIWFRIVRNFFRSATAGEFDVIVGNPPWIRWSKLPDAYRDRVKPTCAQYDIFSDTPHHGGNELDISGMITYTTADKWLRMGGTLAFVITQTHFQSPSSQGFRRFRINSADRLVPVSVDDMKSLKPFPEAANKTSVVVFRKETAQPSYPVPYRVWTKSGTTTRAIPPALPLAKVLDRLSERGCEANPVEGEGSPWAILPPGRFASVSRIIGRSNWVHGRKGITTDLNGVYFVPIEAFDHATGVVKVSTRPDAGRTGIGPARSFWIEPKFLYPLLKGARDFETCYLKPCHGLFALVPNRGITREAYEDCDGDLNTVCPRTKRYFEVHDSYLRQRSTWRGRMANAPSYAIYNVGSYTFAPYKVIWAEQSGTFEAAVATSDNVPLVGQRPYVPDHKIFFVEFDEPWPAYFLCGLLAAPLVKEFVESHNISIQVGNIFKHMRLPSFDEAQQTHRQLAQEVKLAHEQHNATLRARIVTRLRSQAEAIINASR